MRILQLTPRVAWPPTDGGRVVMLQVARALHALGAHVEVLSLNPRRQHVDVPLARDAFAPIPFDALTIDTSAHLTALRRSLRLRAPQLVARFYAPEFERLVRERAGDFDVVQIESPFLMPYARAVRGPKIVLRSLNVEFRIWERLAANETNLLRRAALSAVARSLRRYEIEQANDCDALVPITALDAAEFRAFGCTRPMHVLPGGVEVPPPSAPQTKAVGFLGSLDYRPNQEAALWISEQLAPRLDAAIHVAGSRAPQWLRTRLTNVIFEGEVADARAFTQRMAVMIAPIHSGGGMRIKILEAMAAGRPVVTTTIGAEGLDVTHGENILIADDAPAFASAIASLLDDPKDIGANARDLVATRYSPEVLARGLLTFYEALTSEGARR